MERTPRRQNSNSTLVSALLGLSAAFILLSPGVTDLEITTRVLDTHNSQQLPLRTPASTLIAGGKETVEYPGVVFLNQNCTATFITDRVLLTAAHCMSSSFPRAITGARTNTQTQLSITWSTRKNEVLRRSPAEVHFISEENSPRALGSRSYMSRLAKLYFAPETLDYDLALLVLPRAEKIETVPVCERKPEAEEKVSLIGYGYNQVDGKKFRKENITDYSGKGTKRIGTNRISSLTENTIQILGKLFEAGGSKEFSNNITLPYDSGSPLLSKENCILGVNSGGYTSLDDHAEGLKRNEKISIYERLDTEHVSTWIRKVLQEIR